MKKIIALGILVICAAVSSCWYNHKWEDLHKAGSSGSGSGCDTSGTISFNNQIKPLLTTNCGLSIGMGCHDASNTGGLDYNIATNVQMDATSGTLMFRLRKPTVQPTHMPKGGGFLPTCDSTKFRNWIIQGSSITN